MCADSIHGSIEIKMKKCPEIFTFQDFVDDCDKSRGVMQYYNFYDFEDSHHSKKSRKIMLPHFDSLSAAEF